MTDHHLADASAFFEACETGKGWDECKKFCTAEAAFSAQAEPLADIKSLEAYVEWMKGLGTVTMPGCTYDLHHASYDAKHHSAAFYATFKGTHTGPGPCAPTGKSTSSDYCYIIHFNDGGKIDGMVKVWHAMWAMRELGWA